MVGGGHQEVTVLLVELRPDFAVSGKFVIVAWHFVVSLDVVDIDLLVLLGGLDLVSLQEHLHLQTEVVLITISADSKEVEPVLVVHCILSVVFLSPLDVEVLVVLRIVCQHDGLPQFLVQHVLRDQTGCLKSSVRWLANGWLLLKVLKALAAHLKLVVNEGDSSHSNFVLLRFVQLGLRNGLLFGFSGWN